MAVDVTSCVDPSLIVACAVKLGESPTFAVVDVGETVITVALGGTFAVGVVDVVGLVTFPVVASYGPRSPWFAKPGAGPML